MYSSCFSKYKDLSNEFRPFSRGDCFFILPVFPNSVLLFGAKVERDTCLFNRQSCMKLENIFLSSWRAETLPSLGKVTAGPPGLLFSPLHAGKLEMGATGALLPVHLIPVLRFCWWGRVSGRLLKSHSHFSVPLYLDSS